MHPRKDIASVLEQAGDRPRARLRAIAAMRAELDRAEHSEVASAVRDGMSWSQVGDALGVTRQAAHKKHSPQLRENGDGDGGERRVTVAADAREAIRCARQEAAQMGASTVGTEHILIGLMRVECRAADALRASGATLEALRSGAEPTLELSRAALRAEAQPGLSPLVRGVLEQTLREAMARGDRELRADHLLFAILRDPTGGASRTLERIGVEPASVRTELEWTR